MIWTWKKQRIENYNNLQKDIIRERTTILEKTHGVEDDKNLLNSIKWEKMMTTETTWNRKNDYKPGNDMKKPTNMYNVIIRQTTMTLKADFKLENDIQR